MNYKFNIHSYICVCVLFTTVLVTSFVSYSLDESKNNHDNKVATLMAFSQEKNLQHKLIINAIKSFFKSSVKVNENEFSTFTRELLGAREALIFTLTPEMRLGYISDEKFAPKLEQLKTILDEHGNLRGKLDNYELIGVDINDPHMPYLFYATPIKRLLFNINKLKNTCFQYSSSQLSVKNKNCMMRSTSIIPEFFSHNTKLKISLPEYNFDYTLSIGSRASPSMIIEFVCVLLSLIFICSLIFVLLYFKLENKRLFKRITRENKLNVAMVSSINHEIRTPINALLGYSQMLRDMPEISDEHSALIEKVQWSANLLSSVAESTLNYSKSTAGALVLNNAPINTLQYIGNIQDYYNKLSIPADKTLDFHVSDKLPAVISVDSSKLFQVITNMINNALKYSTGKAVRCHIDVCQRAGFNEESIIRGHYVRILIQDSGLGMSTLTKELLINPFTVDTESKLKHVSSIGLGLYTCNQLLAQVGGKLRLHSVKNEGTKIMLHFPCQFDSSRLSLRLNPIHYRDVRILIVDDNRFNLEVCNAMLAEKQFNTVCANNSEMALTEFENAEPDVVIVDYQLDEMNGLELIAKMKCIQANAQTQYFILSANDKNEIVDSEFHSDIYFMQKPFNTAIFLSCLGRDN
ncbi:Putative uncharacterized protein [Moritella viscosa]|uniref:ATP-binding response regulator n=1 Tax=Moritella viscosa TaxID=80854 RepID=UPI000914DBC8|nr:ATP-binding protein [Moritella viscosa]SGY85765.1 Putative uncharacterized protein [Moritella viscosa]